MLELTVRGGFLGMSLASRFNDVLDLRCDRKKGKYTVHAAEV
jgi:hypothetical protein